jgi:hypothetical protein
MPQAAIPDAPRSALEHVRAAIDAISRARRDLKTRLPWPIEGRKKGAVLVAFWSVMRSVYLREGSNGGESCAA